MSGPERIIAVGGGKGGVGKTLVAANLAVAIAQTGRSVICVDCDLGAANLHTTFGLTSVSKTLSDFLYRRVPTLQESVEPTPVKNLSIIAGSGAVPGAANIAHTQKTKLIRHLRQLDADVVILDVGAGVAYNTIDLFCSADIGVAVCSPQLPSIQNVYSFLKSSVYRRIQQQAQNAQERQLYKELEEKDDTEGAAAFIQRIDARAPRYAQRARESLAAFSCHLVGNLCFNEREENTFYAVSRMMMDFLLVEVPFIAALSSSRRAHDSINRRRPLLCDAHIDVNTKRLRAIAGQLLSLPVARQTPQPSVAIASTESTDEGVPEATAQVDIPLAVEDNTRRATRYAVSMPAMMVVGQEAYRCVVREISTHGVLIQTDAEIVVPSNVELLLDEAPDESLNSTAVRQCRKDEYGLELAMQCRLNAEVVVDYAERFSEGATVPQVVAA